MSDYLDEYLSSHEEYFHNYKCKYQLDLMYHEYTKDELTFLESICNELNENCKYRNGDVPDYKHFIKWTIGDLGLNVEKLCRNYCAKYLSSHGCKVLCCSCRFILEKIRVKYNRTDYEINYDITALQEKMNTIENKLDKILEKLNIN